MAMEKIKRGLPAVHPGAILREDVLPALKAAGTPAIEVAQLLGVSRRALYNVLEGKAPVSPQLALRLGKLCGNGPTVWMGLQSAYDLEKAREEIGAELDAIPTLKVA